MLTIIFFRGSRKSFTGSYTRKIDILVVIKFQDQKKESLHPRKEKSCCGFLSRENFGNFGVFLEPKEKHAGLTIFLDFAISLPQHSHTFLVNSVS